MKKVIIAKHTGKNADSNLRFWEYDVDTINYYQSNYGRNKYAIVDSIYGYQLVKIIGFADVVDEFEAKQKVVAFLPKDYLKENKYE